MTILNPYHLCSILGRLGSRPRTKGIVVGAILGAVLNPFATPVLGEEAEEEADIPVYERVPIYSKKSDAYFYDSLEWVGFGMSWDDAVEHFGHTRARELRERITYQYASQLFRYHEKIKQYAYHVPPPYVQDWIEFTKLEHNPDKIYASHYLKYIENPPQEPYHLYHNEIGIATKWGIEVRYCEGHLVTYFKDPSTRPLGITMTDIAVKAFLNQMRGKKTYREMNLRTPYLVSKTLPHRVTNLTTSTADPPHNRSWVLPDCLNAGKYHIQNLPRGTVMYWADGTLTHNPLTKYDRNGNTFVRRKQCSGKQLGKIIEHREITYRLAENYVGLIAENDDPKHREAMDMLKSKGVGSDWDYLELKDVSKEDFALVDTGWVETFNDCRSKPRSRFHSAERLRCKDKDGNDVKDRWLAWEQEYRDPNDPLKIVWGPTPPPFPVETLLDPNGPIPETSFEMLPPRVQNCPHLTPVNPITIHVTKTPETRDRSCSEVYTSDREEYPFRYGSYSETRNKVVQDTKTTFVFAGDRNHKIDYITPWAVVKDTCARRVTDTHRADREIPCPPGQVGIQRQYREHFVSTLDYASTRWRDMIVQTVYPYPWRTTSTTCEPVPPPPPPPVRSYGNGNDANNESIDVNGDGIGDFSNSHAASRAGFSKGTSVTGPCGACNGKGVSPPGKSGKGGSSDSDGPSGGSSGGSSSHGSASDRSGGPTR